MDKDNSMFEYYFEIAFEAEMNTSESPELLEIAKEQCNEYSETRALAITELREMIFERGECTPHRTDDVFLLKFLRARMFVVPRAHRLLVRYYEFRKQYPYLYDGVDLWELGKTKNAYEGVLWDRPDVGRITIFRFGMWDPSDYPVEDLVRAGMVMTEIAIRQPKLQVLGGTVIVDLEGLSIRHVATLTPTIAYQIVCLMGLTTPTRLKTCHFVNYSWILHTFFYLFKRFIPGEMWSKIYFHGFDMKSLQQHIDPECLPTRYGGTCRNLTSCGLWLNKIRKYRNKEFDNDMKRLGYVIKE